jgi:hypothetical protein
MDEIPPTTQADVEVSAAPEARPKRKRGAQPGNHNAIKPGFYARPFTLKEVEDLKELEAGVADEISLLRLLLRRVIDYSEREDINLEQWLSMLQRLSLVANRLTGMVRTQHTITNGKNDFDTLMSKSRIQRLASTTEEER